MKTKPQVWIKLRFLFSVSSSFFNPIPTIPISKTRAWPPVSAISTITALINGTLDENLVEEARDDDPPINSADVFRKWGCSDNEIDTIFMRRPSLRRADPDLIQSKLNVLRLLGLTSSDIVKIINFRSTILTRRINRCSDDRIKFFLELFGSRELLHKAIVRNPSLLIYDLDSKIKRVVELYEGMGVPRQDFIVMVLSRPTVLSRTSFNDEKLEYIRRTGVSEKSKMYKYVVVLIGISRLETIQEKVGNLEKFGFSEDEVLGLFGRSPLVLTLSTDKVQRNMTYVLGTMKLPARVVLDRPFLLFANLEAVLKPRYLLAEKIEEMGLVPQIKGPKLLTALRMKEDRFLRTFVACHPESISKELMEYYRNIKGLKRLALASKKNSHQGFAF